MLKRPFILIALLVLVVNIVLIRANARLVYNFEERNKEAPEIKVFQTGYDEGTQVTFNHQDHAEVYGIECIECHHLENCSHCHKKEPVQTEIEESKVALHQACKNCHSGIEEGPEGCTECHKK